MFERIYILKSDLHRRLHCWKDKIDISLVNIWTQVWIFRHFKENWRRLKENGSRVRSFVKNYGRNVVFECTWISHCFGRTHTWLHACVNAFGAHTHGYMHAPMHVVPFTCMCHCMWCLHMHGPMHAPKLLVPPVH